MHIFTAQYYHRLWGLLLSAFPMISAWLLIAAAHTSDQEAAENKLGRCYQPERPFCTLTRYTLRRRTAQFTCLSAPLSGRETRVHAGRWHAGHNFETWRESGAASFFRMEIWRLFQKLDAAGFYGTSVPSYQTVGRVTFKKTMRGFYVRENVESRYFMPNAVARRLLPVAVLTVWAIDLRLICPRKTQKACVTSDE
jgi:hypothetical protein